MNDQDHSLSLSDPDRSLVLSHFLTNFLQNLASCHTAFTSSISSISDNGVKLAFSRHSLVNFSKNCEFYQVLLPNR
jgi:hypothetical protein